MGKRKGKGQVFTNFEPGVPKHWETYEHVRAPIAEAERTERMRMYEAEKKEESVQQKMSKTLQSQLMAAGEAETDDEFLE